MEIFNVFKANKRILLFLIDEQIIIMDNCAAKEIITKHKYENCQYPEYFAHDLKSFISKNWFQERKELTEKINEEVPENFNELM